MLSQEAPPPPPSAPLVRSGRVASRQLALPLPPPGPPGPGALVLEPRGGAVVRPRQVWARLPPPIRAEVRRLVGQVLEEVIRDERHT
jgi:hypothetical protein